MKSSLILSLIPLSVLSLMPCTLSAQDREERVGPGPRGVRPAERGEVEVRPGRPGPGRRGVERVVVPQETAVVRGRLSIAPRIVVMPERVERPVRRVRPGPGPRPGPGTTTIVTPGPAPAPEASEVIRTTKTTTVVDEPRRPRRVYNAERNVVVVEEEQGQARELPYVTLPVLFVKSTAELLDSESRAALDQIAGVILEVNQSAPGAVFDIEGHTSTEGTEEFNMSLSTARAQRIYDELTRRYRVPASSLVAHGYGEMYPEYPDGTEEELQQDRRVLVVRAK